MIQSESLSRKPDKRALLEQYLKNRGPVAPKTAPSIPRRVTADRVPLSFAQEQVWLHAQMAPDLPLYNEPVTIHYTGSLNRSAFERAFNEILRRHEAWRTSFDLVDGQPVQVIHPELNVSIPFVDLSHLPSAERDAEAIRIATADASVPLDLSRAPLFRLKLIRLDENRHRLYLTLSHIIFDGVAIYRVFLPELAALYKAFAQGLPSPLPELPFQYPDYAVWQHSADQRQKLSDDLAYWRKTLAGEIPVLDLPADRPRPAMQSFRGSMYPWVLNLELTTRLKALAQSEGVTLFQTLLAGFAVLLQHYSGQDDIPIGTVTSGRDAPGTTSLLGYFLNTLCLRLDLSGDLTFRDLLKRARNATLEALAHDSVPFGTLVSELRTPRDHSRNPLFQSMFSLEPKIPDLDSGWQLTQMDVDTGATKYDIYLELDERRDGILARYHYSTDLFDRTTIVRMAEEWTTLLNGAASAPDKRLHELPVLTDACRRKVVCDWNATEQSYPATTIHGLFEAQVKRTPDATAVEFEKQWLTYANLNARANRLARHLQKAGVGREQLVGICLERSLNLPVALLGTLKAGGAYIPLDPMYPPERLQFVVSDAKPVLIITQESLRSSFAGDVNIISIDGDWRTISQNSDADLDTAIATRDLAYVIYTSGSTGKPKGVQIEHRSVVNFLTSMQREPGLTAKDALLAVTTMSFDIAGLEMYLPLIAGARVVIAPPEIARDGPSLQKLITDSRATIMQATPSTWRLLLESGWTGCQTLAVLCGGEAMPPELAADLVKRVKSVFNMYGPTETTIWSSVHRMSVDAPHNVSIGRPIANTKFYILDRHQNPAPIGVLGEIYIGGHGVARGYLNRQDLTEKRFIGDPFDSSDGARLYKTGDIARYRADGSIEFLGRADDQIKIRGFRVELGEIEATLARHDSVKTAVAVLRKLTTGDARLLAYVVPEENAARDGNALREFLRATLPEYMIPTQFLFVDHLPLTPNGKIDRKALPDLPDAAGARESAVVPPRNDVERELVRIWETLLETSPIGVTDDFFAMGGHSILAVRLFAQIEKAFGQSIPLATLLKAPTIAQLGEALRSDSRASHSSQWTSLVPLQRSGGSVPLFCVHGHFGEILFYRPLAAHLGNQRPFYALQAVTAGKGGPAHRSIEQMAEHYLSEIRQARPHGPYCIAGYCFGSLVAFEMAQRLMRDGEEVAFLGLFIGYESKSGGAPRLGVRLRRHTEQLRQIGWKAKVTNLASNARLKVQSRLWKIIYRTCRELVHPSSSFFHNVPEMNLQAAKRYAAQFYPGKMTVFLSGELPASFVLNPQTDLHGMNASEIDLHIVPGERYTMMQDPHAAILARELRACLNR